MDEQRAFGSYLRAERELRQIPLAEVASATKIPLHSLEALETGCWDALPAEIFVRGFVRSYVRYVGLPENDACQRFNRIVQDAIQTQREDLQGQTDPPLDPEITDVGGRRKFGLALLVIIVLILATITLSLFWRRGAGASTHSWAPVDSMSESCPGRTLMG